MIFHYRQEITPTLEGYRVSQTLTGSELPADLTPEERVVLQQTMTSFPVTEFDADESLAPIRIVEWDKLIVGAMEMVARAVGDTAEGNAAVDTVGRALKAMTPEQAAASMMKEQAMLAAPQNMSLDVGQVFAETYDTANPLGGGKIKADYRVTLESLDKAAGAATIRVTQTLDSDSLSNSTRAVLLGMAQRLPAGTPKPTQAELAGIKMENVLDCRSRMDVRTGLAARTDCEARISAVGPDLKPRVRIDRWVITQRLVR